MKGQVGGNTCYVNLVCCAGLGFVTQSCLTFCDPMNCSPPGASVLGDSPGQNTGVGSLSLFQGIFPTQGSNPGIEPRSPTLQADSLPAEPPRKPRKTGMGSLSLLQRIFLTQELNQGFPGGSEGKASACNVGDPGSIPGWGRSPGEGNGNPLQYSCLENPMDRRA